MDADLRLTLLHMAAVMGSYSDTEILIRSIHMIRTKSPRIAQWITRKTVTDIQQAIQLVRAVWNGISKGVFIPNPGSWKCNYCGYKDHCNSWFGL
jgi:CRISPR/Cas system-associated exonuclease Cas4 (RecB family)